MYKRLKITKQNTNIFKYRIYKYTKVYLMYKRQKNDNTKKQNENI